MRHLVSLLGKESEETFKYLRIGRKKAFSLSCLTKDV